MTTTDRERNGTDQRPENNVKDKHTTKTKESILAILPPGPYPSLDVVAKECCAHHYKYMQMAYRHLRPMYRICRGRPTCTYNLPIVFADVGRCLSVHAKSSAHWYPCKTKVGTGKLYAKRKKNYSLSTAYNKTGQMQFLTRIKEICKSNKMHRLLCPGMYEYIPVDIHSTEAAAPSTMQCSKYINSCRQ